VLRKIFRPKKGEVSEQYRCIFYRIMLSGYGNIRNAYKIWWWNLLGNILFEKRNDEERITLR
jgi:hypothetical protein